MYVDTETCIQVVNHRVWLKCLTVYLMFQKVKVDEKAGSWQQSMDVCAQDAWLDKAEVCLSLGLFQPARQLLAEAHLVSKVS